MSQQEQQQTERVAGGEIIEPARGFNAPPQEKVFLPSELHGEEPIVKLVYRYIRKCQNAGVVELMECVGLSEEQVRSSLERLAVMGFVTEMSESEPNRFAVVD